MIDAKGPTKRRRGRTACYPVFSDCDSDLHNYYWRSNRGGYVMRTINSCNSNERQATSFGFAHREVLQRILARPLSPDEKCDHINGNKLDNRRENLRLTTPQGNAQNRGPINATGIRGVTYHGASGKWQAQVRFCKKTYYCGLFESADEAGLAAASKRKELGFLEGNYGRYK